MHWDRHRIYVHAGIDPDKPLDAQLSADLLWKRYAEGDERGHGTMHVVHGHTPILSGPLLLQGRTNLDVGAFKTGRLVVAVFKDDRPGGPVDLIEVTA